MILGDNGEPLVAPGSYDSRGHGAGAGIVLAWPALERFTLSGVAGMARTTAHGWRFTVLEPVAGAPGVVTSIEAFGGREWKPYYGVGMDYAITPQLAVSLEAQRYRLPGDGNPVDVASAGLVYRFR